MDIRSKLVSHAVPTLFNVPQNSAQTGDRLGVSGDGSTVPPFGEWIGQFHDEFKCLECQPWRLPFNDQGCNSIDILDGLNPHCFGISDQEPISC